MEVTIECGCGNRASEYADGNVSRATSVECGGCDAVWAVTITPIRDGDSAA
ncbi:hypothetical protein KY092_08890 [Natronomonas gomsonensis]|jgi:hypothetical protein|uniref:hypothetical protein n=1 Tax=Natronomonas gomsonensis TaxID=1046043 RepID=UPI0020CA663E|nr:hypothetical protein [Natronomonas gomsonensis]MCY4730672.1 hypothetical protein [Natronomonas gomsonensis]